MPMRWLNENVPGFVKLSSKERDAILEFFLLWSLFEAQILCCDADSKSIRRAVRSWAYDQMLESDECQKALEHFKKRYSGGDNAKGRLAALHLNIGGLEESVIPVIDGKISDPAKTLIAMFCIVYRYRNNLFHGNKWKYNIEDQFENFSHANNILKLALDCYGNLDD